MENNLCVSHSFPGLMGDPSCKVEQRYGVMRLSFTSLLRGNKSMVRRGGHLACV